MNNIVQQAIEKDALLVVGGPTGSGKTDFALKLAQKYNGILINADSRQIYRDLSIGTNVGDIVETGTVIELDGQKLPIHQLDGIPIHLLQFLEPTERFDVATYRVYAKKIIQEIQNLEKVPIVVGGTGLYIDSLIRESYSFQSSDQNPQLRNQLAKKSLEEIQLKIKNNNAEVWEGLNKSDRNNKRRLIRVLEKINAGTYETSRFKNEFINHLMFYPEFDWVNLKEKIEKRAYAMFDEGLIKETEKATNKYGEDAVALQGIGYKEVQSYLRDEITLETCKERVAIAHRQYAKRQKTWFEGKGRGYTLTKFSP